MAVSVEHTAVLRAVIRDSVPRWYRQCGVAIRQHRVKAVPYSDPCAAASVDVSVRALKVPYLGAGFGHFQAYHGHLQATLHLDEQTAVCQTIVTDWSGAELARLDTPGADACRFGDGCLATSGEYSHLLFSTSDWQLMECVESEADELLQDMQLGQNLRTFANDDNILIFHPESEQRGPYDSPPYCPFGSVPS